jgi:hypothetical protein
VCVPLLKDIYRYYFLTRKYELWTMNWYYYMC